MNCTEQSSSLDFRTAAQVSLGPVRSALSHMKNYAAPALSILGGTAVACAAGGPGWGLLTVGGLAWAFNSNIMLSPRSKTVCHWLATAGITGFAACLALTGNPALESNETAVKSVLNGSLNVRVERKHPNLMSSWGKTHAAVAEAKIVKREGNTVTLFVNGPKGTAIETHEERTDALGRPEFKKIDYKLLGLRR